MRRISIAFVLSTLLLVSICSAQQTSTSDNKHTNSGRDASPIGIEGPVIGGDGTANYIPIWRTPNYLLSSVIYQASGGNIGIGTTTPGATLDVHGVTNTSLGYQIAGSTVLSTGSTVENVFLGVYAGESNTNGLNNTFAGYGAGLSNTSGSDNAFFGAFAGGSNTTGYYNTFLGGAGEFNTTGNNNTFVGLLAGDQNTTGSNNAFSGSFAGYNNTTGNDNTFSGSGAGYGNTGNNNTFYGFWAGMSNTTGNNNTFLGYYAGYNNNFGSNDIYIGNMGCPSPCAENSTIRIGGDTGYGPQTATYIAGVYGASASGGVSVYINANGQLGTQTSSLRFKEQVRDMGDSTNALMKLRPVTFLYKPEYAKGERTLQYGLIAEEVAKVYPELVAYDNDGQPYTVRYQYITTMLLNEVQKQYHRAEAEARVITAQEQKIDELEQRLSRLESLIPQTVAQK